MVNVAMALAKVILLSLFCIASICNAQQQYAETIPSPPSGFLGALRRIISPPSPVDTIAMPDCLIALTGGIDAVEGRLQSELQDGNTWVTLVTTKNDQMSVVAVKKFYDAVRQMCGETTSEESQETFEEHEQVEFDAKLIKNYRFAHISFDNEPAMMWRWMIWKVPTIVFVTPKSTSSKRLYDLRFWKIAWNVPSVQTIISSMPDRQWAVLPVWDSNFAPGEQFDVVFKVTALGFNHLYGVLDRFPPWLLAIVGSFAGSMLLTWLHKDDAAQTTNAKTKTPPQSSSSSRSVAPKKSQ